MDSTVFALLSIAPKIIRRVSVQSQFVRSVKEEEVPTVQNAPVPALMFRAGTDMVLPSAHAHTAQVHNALPEVVCYYEHLHGRCDRRLRLHRLSRGSSSVTAWVQG